MSGVNVFGFDPLNASTALLEVLLFSLAMAIPFAFLTKLLHDWAVKYFKSVDWGRLFK